MRLGRSSGDKIEAHPISRTETNDTFDVAVFETSKLEVSAHAWSLDGMLLGAPMLTAGFPHALDVEMKTVTIRVFRGHIVAATRSANARAVPAVYELSFQCPRGLSGAALLLDDTYPFLNVGMVIGNATVEMPVLRSRERDGNQVIDHMDVMHLGIALPAQSISEIRFDLLGGTVQDHLRRHGLLTQARANSR